MFPEKFRTFKLDTIGGALNRVRDSALKQGKAGFFQIDVLGFGPWLDRETATWTASATGGEAYMVEKLIDPTDESKKEALEAHGFLKHVRIHRCGICGFAVKAGTMAAHMRGSLSPKPIALRSKPSLEERRMQRHCFKGPGRMPRSPAQRYKDVPQPAWYAPAAAHARVLPVVL